MNVLEKIVADKRLEVEQRKLDFPVSEFEAQLEASDRNFKQALLDKKDKGEPGFILEVKKASPSKGLIRPVFDLDEICEAYSQYATCVSVLTDEKYFQGNFERLPKVRNRLSQPVLCKDFMLDEYQVKLARYYGANAILLMLSVLSDDEYQTLAACAKSLGLSILTEVSNSEEMTRAIELKADILGINNRNLRDLSTDLRQSQTLVQQFVEQAPKAQQEQTVLISESGIYFNDQVKKLFNIVDGFLVGSSLMAQSNINQAAKELLFGQHKVCGITRVEDALSAFNAGASYTGLIFVEQSPRFIATENAKELVGKVQSEVPHAKFVAVVKDHKLSEVINLVEQLNPAAIQLHGNEPQSFIDELSDYLTQQQSTTEIWKVVAVEANGELPVIWPKADKILLDTKTADGQNGGTGQSFDWHQLTKLPLNLPPVILAGGLNLDNLKQAIKLPVNGVDLNSGVEVSPGVKSADKINAAFTLLSSYQ